MLEMYVLEIVLYQLLRIISRYPVCSRIVLLWKVSENTWNVLRVSWLYTNTFWDKKIKVLEVLLNVHAQWKDEK